MFFVSLCGVKETFSEIERKDFISHSSRLTAEGGRAVSAGLCFIKRGTAGQCNATQSHHRKYRCYQCITF